MVFFIALSVAVFIGMLVEMLTYSIGDGGIITRLHRKYKATNIDIALGLGVSMWIMWKGSSFAAVVATIVFIVCAIIGCVRLEKRLNQVKNQ